MTTSLFSDAEPLEWGVVTSSEEPTGPEDDVEPDTSKVNIIDPDTEYVAPPKRKPRNTKLKTGLEGMYGVLGTAVFVADPQFGQVIFQNASNCAEALDQLAKENANVRRVLEGMLETSAWGAVIAAHLPIMIYAGTKYVPALRDSYNAKFTAE